MPQDNPDYEGPEGSRLRDEASHFAEERSKLYDAATAKRESGDHHAANQLVAQAKEMGERMKEKNREAAEAIYQYNNAGKGDLYLDLHGLREDEAMEFLRERVDKLEEGTAVGLVVDFEVIPGAGHHSGPGGPKLKAATERFFKSRGIAYESINDGAFMAKIEGKRTSVDGGTAGSEPQPSGQAKPETKTSSGGFCCCM